MKCQHLFSGKKKKKKKFKMSSAENFTQHATNRVDAKKSFNVKVLFCFKVCILTPQIDLFI